ncbi:MAG: sulfurtransferase-like selenium metabolism protein YedF [Deltaproteobacteria bacterium]
MNTIDCRNMACPAPVVAVKKALDDMEEITVMLDDGAPKENVGRFARNRGYSVAEQQDGAGGWLLTITAPADGKPAVKTEAAGDMPVLLITSNCMGDGPKELGLLLMKNFIHTLLETEELPSRILFVNTGVFLTSEGSDVLEALEKLQGMGVEILSCGLCLNFFDIKEKLKVGATTNMLAIAESLLASPKVIRL